MRVRESGPALTGWPWNRNAVFGLASAMQFPYKDAIINVLDTPGHQDFSEDTYRTLTAADSAIMVIDAAKGVETQTRKLFAVCRMKGIPILTFINKMNLQTRATDLMTEVEEALGIQAAPMNWPIGSGKSFVGVVELESRAVVLFKRSEQGGALRALVDRKSFSEFRSMPGVDQDVIKVVDDNLELLETAGNKFDYDAFLAGRLRPYSSGLRSQILALSPSSITLCAFAPPPRPYAAVKKDGSEFEIKPSEHEFSGFVLKSKRT